MTKSSTNSSINLPLAAMAGYPASNGGLHMQRRTRILNAFILSTILMAVLGTVAQTQFVLAELAAVGAEATVADRLSMTGADLLGFAPLYGAIIAAGFMVAFAIGALVLRTGNLPPTAVYAAAGGACIWIMLALMREVFFGIPLIAGARTTTGELVQVAIGVLAGAIFAILSGDRPNPSRQS